MSVTSAAVLLHKMREGSKLIQNPYGRFALTTKSGAMFEVTYRAASTLLRHKQIRYTDRPDNRGARILVLTGVTGQGIRPASSE